MVEIVKRYKLGEPKDASTTLGPVVSQRSAGVIRKQVADAGESTLCSGAEDRLKETIIEAAGAKLLVPSSLFPNAREGTCLVAPQGMRLSRVIPLLDEGLKASSPRQRRSYHGHHDSRDLWPSRRDHEGRPTFLPPTPAM